jgi:hypothetical protein
VKRRWFEADGGGFYRNCPLIMDEIERTPSWRWRKRRALDAEWEQAFNGPFPRIDVLGADDVLVAPMPMREAYPDRPVFWAPEGRGRA